MQTRSTITICCLLTALLASSVAFANKQYLLPIRKDFAIYQKLEAKPGDTIVLKGNYAYINLWGFEGTPEKQIVFVNEGIVHIGQMQGVGTYGWSFHNAKFFKIQGIGSNYPIKVSGGGEKNTIALAIGKGCSDYSVDNIELSNGSAGVLAKVNPDGKPENSAANFAIRNIKFTHLYIHNIRGEGMYIGNTKGSSDAPRIYNCEIAFVKTDSTGWDGIQLALCPEGGSIHDCEVSNYGTTNTPNQRNGIIVGGGTNAQVYNNTINNGTGTGICILGTGHVKVYKNNIANTGEDGIFVDDRPIEGLAPLTVAITDNVIANSKPFGIKLFNTNNTVMPGEILRNKIVGCAKQIIDRTNSKKDL